ncbi:MAG: hypothetical protein ABIU54_02905 [Candidatus Eisenbacteria bacterium]
MHVRHGFLGALCLCLLFPSLTGAAALGRQFTYQGQLNQSGTPVNSTVSFRFSLWADEGTGNPPSGGVQVGASQLVPNVPVVAGLFSAAVNANDEFGPTAFNGQARWLQVEVCETGACSVSTVLGPRQPVTAAPYALGPWQLSGTNLSYTQGRVGIGTASPAAMVHVQGTGPALLLQDMASASNQAGYLSFWNDVSVETGWFGYGTAGSPHMSVVNARSGGGVKIWAGGAERLSLISTGSVGIGTTAPTQKLDVRGDVKLGSSGQYFAAGGQENFKIVRGTVGSGGAITEGTGFTATRTGVGAYTLTFSPAFPTNERPSTAVTAVGSITDMKFAMVLGPSSNTSVFVRIFTAAGVAADASFDFVAVGLK